jgi:hypothetical protein
MDHTKREPASPIQLPEHVAHEWYLNGFSDGYHSQRAVTPSGPAGEHYDKGYTQGLVAAQRDSSSPTWYLFSKPH